MPAGGEAGQGEGIWHFRKIQCQIPNPWNLSAGQIIITQGQKKSNIVILIFR